MAMSSGSARPAGELEALSAMVDGELDADGLAKVCARWRDDGALRETWHAWHLIGDVLRSDDLASPPRRDEQFLAGLRSRLAAEPVVLAPPRRAAAVALRRRSRWIASSAVAAGFVVVAAAVLVTRDPAPQGAPALAQRAPVEPARVVPTAVAGGEADPQALVANPTLIRDARLDRYLAAHKQFAGSSALGVPSGVLRAATTESTPR
jgi:sigma-E factor negative regulatory protein RseA